MILFWELKDQQCDLNFAYLHSKTCKSNFDVISYQAVSFCINGERTKDYSCEQNEGYISFVCQSNLLPNQELVVEKMGGYCSSLQQPIDRLPSHVQKIALGALDKGFDALLKVQKSSWENIWKTADINICGDIKAQQGIRFNIFQLNQTYTGNNPKLNIGPKGFTGEKYGGSTYWDTEAYCFPFYMATKNESVAENLLNYRYNHLERAIENAGKLGFNTGAALYPMVTMNGEECHNSGKLLLRKFTETLQLHTLSTDLRLTLATKSIWKIKESMYWLGSQDFGLNA